MNLRQILSFVGSLWVLLAVIFVLRIPDTDDLVKQVAKEYNIPVSDVKSIFAGKVQSDTKYFLIPHTVWYITTEDGEDVEIASDYFGGDIDFYKDVLNKYFSLDSYSEIYKEYQRYY